MRDLLSSVAIRPAVPRSLRAILVLAGDVGAILAFVVVGVYSHGGYPWDIPWYTLKTLTPFLLAWAVIAPLTGVYHPETLVSYKLSILLVIGTWISAAILGGLLRGTSLFLGGTPIVFVLVTILFGSLFLSTWRLVALRGLEIRTNTSP